MRLYIADASKIDESKVNLLDKMRREKVNKLRLTLDKKCSIAAGLFVKRFFGDSNIHKNEFGKPYAENGKFFNISHSNQYVLFAVSDCEVGCDIEAVKYVDSLRLGKVVYCENEMQRLQNSANRLDTFFDMWTKKESFMKCIGEGFHRSAKSIDTTQNVITDKKRMYYFKTWKFSDFTVSVCSENNDFPCALDFVEL